jgi:hypothetical protein
MGPRLIRGPSLTETSSRGAYLYIKTIVLNAGKPDSVLFAGIKLRKR